MKLTRSSLATVLTLAFGAAVACTPAEEPVDPGSSTGGKTGGGSGGSTGKGGSGSGGSSSGSGGSSASGGSTGSGGSGSGGSGSGGSGSGGASSGGGGGTASGGAGGSASGGAPGDGGVAETGGGAGGAPAPGGKMVLTVDFDMTTSTPDRMCFKPEAGSGGGDKSPKMDWTAPPAGTMSIVVMTEDLSNTPTPHQIVCNMKPTETGRPADVKATLPEGAVAITGHNKPMHRWYGPGAGVRNYEMSVFALAMATFPDACKDAKKTRDFLKMNKTNKAVILDYDSKVLWGSAAGKCK